jgi:hypothetical protein
MALPKILLSMDMFFADASLRGHDAKTYLRDLDFYLERASRGSQQRNNNAIGTTPAAATGTYGKLIHHRGSAEYVELG